MYHYAQINADGVCFASLSTHTPMYSERCIEVPSNPDAYIGRIYADGAWLPA